MTSPCIASQSNNYRITIYKDPDVDAISNCTTFEGHIRVDHSFTGNIDLPKLQTLKGTFGLDFNYQSDLTGVILPNLQTIRSADPTNYPNELWLENAPNLKTVYLPILTSHGGTVNISDLPALTNLSNFNFNVASLGEYGTDFFVQSTSIESFKFSDANDPVDDSPIFGEIRINNNPKLVDLFVLVGNATNMTLSATNIHFNNSEDTREMLYLNQSLEISGCETLQTKKYMSIGSNYSLHDTALVRAPMIVPYGLLNISNNSLLETLDLPSGPRKNLDLELQRGVLVSQCACLTNLSLESNVFNVNGMQGSVNITQCAALTEVGLPMTVVIRGSFNISGCPSIASISLPLVQNIGGDFALSDCDAPMEPLVFPNLETIGGSLTISDCASISDATFPVLRSINGSLKIVNNAQWANITAFPVLKTISGPVNLQGNFSL